MTLSPPIWESLVAETQFAAELTLTGLRRLCSVPADPSQVWGSKDLNYALHVGMYSYSSGLERLCKLAIACNEYATTGEFPKLRNYSHKIGRLLDTVEGLPLPPSGPGVAPRKAKYLLRPSDSLDPDLMNMVERFASGAGRYEHLDSLWDDDAEVNTYVEWSGLARWASVSEEVQSLISLNGAISYAIQSELIDDGLESTGQRVMEDLAVPMFKPSVALALSMYRKVRWVSMVLDVATYYTGCGLPILGEVVSPLFTQSSTSFFKYEILRISDEEVTSEELQAVYERIQIRETEEDEDTDESGSR
jgi:hypothetical protein